VILIAIYVDDCLIIGTDEGIDNIINILRDYNFGLNVNHNLTDHLSYRIHVDYENKTTFVMQTHALKTLEEKFGDQLNNLSKYVTPGTPRFKIVRLGDDIERIDSNLQTRYKLGVGMFF
jgi:Ethanolamine utilization protein EutJ (predicted chaperonin)